MHRKKMWEQMLIVVLLLTLLIAPSAEVEAKKPDTAEEIDSHGSFTYLPMDLENEEEIKRQLEEGKSPEELGLLQGKSKSEPLRTLEEIQEESKQKKQPYTVNMDPPVKTADTWNPPQFRYDYIAKQECLDNPAGGTLEGWAKNRYAFCRAGNFSYVEVQCRGWWPFIRCTTYGVQYRLTLIGFGSNGKREAQFDYYVDNIQVTHPRMNGAKLKIDVNCAALVNPGDCREDASTPAVERTVAQWKNNGFGTKKLYSIPPEITDYNPDRLGYLEFWARSTVSPSGLPTRTQDSPREEVRFDSARYMFVFYPRQYFPHGAIFPRAKPVLQYSLSEPAMNEAAQHYKDAMERPGSTVPPKVNKQIPGAEGDRPLHRLTRRHHPDEYNQNRNRTRSECDRWFPDRPENNQCDEFPFASTWEGTAFADGNFSIRMISADDNNAAGRWLGAWYAYDRIIDGRTYPGEYFHVRVNQ
ncbi:NucA/NucB deoxyribonuclease domain-containing protein [Desmospora activa]|uniref:Deoxyribonuclease NucA/NucB n=1 Tax=Desmospora activa DSM 45169 TaxID=1121389 RepID=A0A2T4Z7A7_9BACL|nr:NucA/NucB deoxyribonuclease domain-containing protein [Desmospora activa]PTM57776.1 deoxyribonuclease NucA/NucB [Desmospora activa DSM 45169]